MAGRKRLISIEEKTQRLFLFSLVNFLIILPAVIFISWGFRLSRTADEQNRNLLLKINSYILALNLLKTEDNPGVNDGILSLAEEVRIDLQELHPLIRENLTFPEPEFRNGEELRAYYDRIVSLAKALRDNSNRLQTFLLSIIGILLFLSGAFTTINMVEHLRWRMYNRRYMDDIRRGIIDLDHILQYRPAEEREDSDIRESLHFGKYVAQIEKNIEFNKRIQELSVFGSLDEILKYVFSLLTVRMPCDRVALAFITDGNLVTAETSYSLYGKYYLEPGFALSLEQCSLGAVAESREYRIIGDLEEYGKGKNSLSTAKLLQEGLRSNLTIPMYFQKKCIGFFFIASREKNSYAGDQADYARRIVDLLKQKLYIEFILQNIIADTSRAFVTLMDEKDNETAQHIKRMSHYSHIIARRYSDSCEVLPPRELREILLYAPLHDIGKIGIPDRILLKEGKLDEGEMEIMKSHVQIGERVIEDINRRLSRSFSIPAMTTAVEIIGGHHEKFDGTGYPRGLKGEEIPLAGRIVALADVFDALTSPRPYKDAFPLDKALDIMKNGMSGQFDPRLFQCFMESLDEINHIREKYGEL